MHTYKVKIRLNNRVTEVTVSARDTAQAKQLVKAQYGGKVDILFSTRVG